MKLITRKLALFIGAFYVGIFNTVVAASSTGLQECQAIKSAAKRADCFEKYSLKMIQEENEKKQRDEIAKVEADKATAEADRAKAESDRAKAEAEKIAIEEKEAAAKLKIIEKANKVLQIVMRLQTRIQTGISYRDYSGVISDPKFEVQSYLRENETEIPEFSTNILLATHYYDVAGTIWGFKFSGGSATDAACHPAQKNYISKALDGANIPETNDRRNYCTGPDIDAAVKVAWRKASENIDSANILMKNIKNYTNWKTFK